MADRSDVLRDLAKSLGVKQIPSYSIFRDGQMVHEEPGMDVDRLLLQLQYYSSSGSNLGMNAADRSEGGSVYSGSTDTEQDGKVLELNGREDFYELLRRHENDDRLVVLKATLTLSLPSFKLVRPRMAFAGWLRRGSSHRRAVSALNSPLPLQLLRQLAPAAIAASYLAEGLAQGSPAAESFHSRATGVCGSGGSAVQSSASPPGGWRHLGNQGGSGEEDSDNDHSVDVTPWGPQCRQCVNRLSYLSLSLACSGVDLLRNPKYNKGLAFTEEERNRLYLNGLLPAGYMSQDHQVDRVLANLKEAQSDLQRYVHLMALQERNERLFYRVLVDHVEQLMPIWAWRVSALGCCSGGPRGLFVSQRDRGRVMELLKNWPERRVRAIVVTDGERVLGLGDLGVQGMAIAVGKLTLYTACGGIHPAEEYGELIDEFMEACVQAALREYDELIDEFMEACKQRFGSDVLIQFEDFANHNAFRLLFQYRGSHLVFNDDIQGNISLVGLHLVLKPREHLSRAPPAPSTHYSTLSPSALPSLHPQSPSHQGTAALPLLGSSRPTRPSFAPLPPFPPHTHGLAPTREQHQWPWRGLLASLPLLGSSLSNQTILCSSFLHSLPHPWPRSHQGTASVALAGLLASLPLLGSSLSNQTILCSSFLHSPPSPHGLAPNRDSISGPGRAAASLPLLGSSLSTRPSFAPPSSIPLPHPMTSLPPGNSISGPGRVLVALPLLGSSLSNQTILCSSFLHSPPSPMASLPPGNSISGPGRAAGVSTPAGLIPGTASVALAGLLASLTPAGLIPVQPDHPLLRGGRGRHRHCRAAGDRNQQRGEHIPGGARGRIWLVDSKGLVVRSRVDSLQPHKVPFAHDHPESADLVETIHAIRPTALIGVSGQAGTFTQPVCEAMAQLKSEVVLVAVPGQAAGTLFTQPVCEAMEQLNERPSSRSLQPHALSECTAEDAYKWTQMGKRFCRSLNHLCSASVPHPTRVGPSLPAAGGWMAVRPSGDGWQAVCPGQDNNAYEFHQAYLSYFSSHSPSHQRRAIFASGSPFAPVEMDGRWLVLGLGNNACVFPQANFFASHSSTPTSVGPYSPVAARSPGGDGWQPLNLPAHHPLHPSTPHSTAPGSGHIRQWQPVRPVEMDGRRFVPGQGNNAYVFPGIGLGCLMCGATRMRDEMFLAAAEALAAQMFLAAAEALAAQVRAIEALAAQVRAIEALAAQVSDDDREQRHVYPPSGRPSECVSDDDREQGRVYPPIWKIRQISAHIARAVAAKAYDLGELRGEL
ncbi:unnamed protein product [Closterium sp. NIES-65]|nr:unnamed protein product [Closterium sp. NIES-65]